MAVFLLVLLLFLSVLGSGVLFVIGLLMNFEFSSKLGPMFFFLNYFLGIVLLVPISLVIKALGLRIFGSDGSKLYLFASETVEFILLCFYLNFSNTTLAIIKFDSLLSEITVYFIFYMLFLLAQYVSDREKKTVVVN